MAPAPKRRRFEKARNLSLSVNEKAFEPDSLRFVRFNHS